MKKIPRFIKISLVVLLIVALAVIGTLKFLFVKTEAPLLYGTVDREIPYNNEFSLDVYYPTQRLLEPSPVVVFLHGGAWIMGSKTSVNFNRFNGAVNTLRNQGFTIISPDYTLARNGTSPFPQCIRDAFQVLNWMHQNAETYGLDTGHYGLLGESAGAHIALMVANANPARFNAPNLKVPPQYVVDAYGPTDLAALSRAPVADSLLALLEKFPDPIAQRFNIEQLLIGFNPTSDPERAQQLKRRFSPIEYLSSSSPPTLVIHGTDDRVVPADQSRALLRKLDELNVYNKAHFLQGVDHSFRKATDAQQDSVQHWVARFIYDQYRNNR